MLRMKVSLVSLIIALALFTGGLVCAQPLRLTPAVPDEAVIVVEKYISTLGKSRIEQMDRLGDSTFLFVARIKNEEIGGEDIIHYIIATKYKGYRVIFDSTEKKPQPR